MLPNPDYYCYSDSDSDDEDVDRYVFLARQPAPAGRHGDAVSEDGDDGGDATADDEESEGGGGRRKRKRHVRVVLDAPPSPKKARLGLITSSLAPTLPSGSDQTASSRCRVRTTKSGSEEAPARCVAVAHEEGALRGGEATIKTKKKVVCGKRSRGPGCEEDGDRKSHRALIAAAKTGTSSAATSGRFLCNLCERCFDSHQALGGHVLGHRKKAKIANAAAASLGDAGGSGNCKEEIAVVEVSQEAANGVGRAEKKAIVATRYGDANGNGNCDEKKTVHEVAEHNEDVDSGGHIKAEKASVDVENHEGNHGDGNSDMKTAVFAESHEGVDGNDRNETNAIAVSSHGFTNGNEEVAIGAASHNDAGSNGNVKGKKAVVGTCHKGVNGNGNNNVRRTPHKCKVCGAECPTGRALGGHMRKHQKRPAHGGEGRPASPVTDEDCQTPLVRLFRHRDLLAESCGDHGGTTNGHGAHVLTEADL